jgi:hypothetical protein
MKYTRSRRTLWGSLAVAAAALAGGSAAVAASTVLHGRGELVSQPLSGDLEVADVRLEPLLVPGAAGDLVLRVRNRSALTVVADRVRLHLPMRDVKPAGCLAKVSGPLLDPGGVALVDGQRVVLGPGRAEQVVVPGALSLAASATGGCGFRVQVDVQAVQSPPTTSPATRPTTEPTATVPSTGPATRPPTTVPTADPATADPSAEPTIAPVTPPPTLPDLDCDAADPACATSPPR